jgi:hypothetical protein
LKVENRIWGLAEVLPLHRPYLGAYCSVSIIILVDIIRFTRKRWIQIALGLSVIYLSVFIFLIISKSAIIGLIAAILVIVAVLLGRISKFYLTLLIAIVVSLIVVILVTNDRVNAFMNKVLKFSALSYEEYDTNIIDSFNRRFEMWYCSVKILANNNTWITGVGLGNEQKSLDTCYSHNGYKHMEMNKFNAHNQLLQDFLTGGILMALASLGVFFIPLIIAVRSENYPFIGFMVIMITFSITEAVLLRQKGVVFYSLFTCLFLFQSIKK